MKQARKSKPGREPERLKIAGSWKDAVKHALRRGKPKPKRARKKERR